MTAPARGGAREVLDMKRREFITLLGGGARLGRLHAKLRLGIETDHEAQIFGQGINFFHIDRESQSPPRG